MKQILILFTLSALILSGCATLNKNECLTADWYEIGYEDGSQGYADTRISAHREACAKHGISTDLRSYQDGYDEGVIRFCSLKNGFFQGSKGYQYTGICPDSLEPEFLDGYEAGRQIYIVASQIRNLQFEQNQNERNIDSMKQLIIQKTNLMLADETSQADRYALNAEIVDMQQEVGALGERNKQIITDVAQAQAQLRSLEERYAYY